MRIGDPVGAAVHPVVADGVSARVVQLDALSADSLLRVAGDVIVGDVPRAALLVQADRIVKVPEPAAFHDHVLAGTVGPEPVRRLAAFQSEALEPQVASPCPDLREGAGFEPADLKPMYFVASVAESAGPASPLTSKATSP